MFKQYFASLVKHRFASLGILVILGSTGVCAIAVDDLPVVESAVLGANSSIPWSKPVKVKDPFEGTFIAVFDRNYFYDKISDASVRIEILSLWSRKSIRVLLTARDLDCLNGHAPSRKLPGLVCSEISGSRKLTALYLKLGEKVLRLSGENNLFSVSDELATVLQQIPDENVKIRLVTENGELVDSEIGKGTVSAWKTVYATATASISKSVSAASVLSY
jgi:hypothetical protein